MRKILAFDIETGPADEEFIRKYMKPYEAPPHPGEFDPASVKYGNMTDPAKRQAKLEGAKEKHAEAVAKWERDTANGDELTFQAAIEQAALSPILGRVLAIGYYGPDYNKGVMRIVGRSNEASEIKMLTDFWEIYKEKRREGWIKAGFNIHSFDLPFIAQRSWILGVPVPLNSVLAKGKWVDDETFVDLRKIWNLNQNGFGCSAVKSDLRNVSSILGVHSKTDGMSGGDFWKMWQGSDEDRKKAITYLRDDMLATYGVAERLLQG